MLSRQTTMKKKKRTVNDKFQEGFYLVPLYVTVNMQHVKFIFSIWFTDFLYTLVCVHAQSSNTSQAHGLNIACQAPLSMGFSRQEYWSGLPLPTLGDLPEPGIKPVSLKFPALAGRFLPAAPPGKQRRDKQCGNGR